MTLNQVWPQLVMYWSKEELVNAALETHCTDQDGKVDGVAIIILAGLGNCRSLQERSLGWL